jgi:hypothetical protein
MRGRDGFVCRTGAAPEAALCFSWVTGLAGRFVLDERHEEEKKLAGLRLSISMAVAASC